MKLIKNAEFGGERPLFESHDLRLENVIIRTGESAIKECSNIETVDCRFEGNYPFWHVHGFKIDRCYFDVGGRSALWYSDHLKMTDTIIDAPKMFREMDEIDIENVTMNDADEVFWRCKWYPHQESQAARRNLSFHVQQQHLCGRTGKQQQVCVPVREKCRDSSCKDYNEGCLLGSGKCDHLRFRTQRRIPRLAFEESTFGQLPHYR